jgi:hypothetical protein
MSSKSAIKMRIKPDSSENWRFGAKNASKTKWVVKNSLNKPGRHSLLFGLNLGMSLKKTTKYRVLGFSQFEYSSENFW